MPYGTEVEQRIEWRETRWVGIAWLIAGPFNPGALWLFFGGWRVWSFAFSAGAAVGVGWVLLNNHKKRSNWRSTISQSAAAVWLVTTGICVAAIAYLILARIGGLLAVYGGAVALVFMAFALGSALAAAVAIRLVAFRPLPLF